MITVGALGPNESDWVWLDSSSGVAPFGMISPALRDKTAVVLVADGASPADPTAREVVRLVTTPAAPPFPCFQRERVEARLSPVGTLDGRVSIDMRGDYEVLLRTLLRMVPAEKHAEFLKAVAGDLHLTGDLTEPSISDPAVAREPLRLGFLVRQENWFDRSKNRTLDLPLEAMSFRYADEKDWKGKDRIRPWTLSDQVSVSTTIDLPPGFVPKLPVDVIITRDYAQYRSTHRLDGSRMTVEQVLTRKAGELPADRMRDYLAFVAAVRSDEAQEIPLDTTKAGPASAAVDATPTELYMLGLSQYDAKDYAGALETWKRVVAADPMHPDAWDALGLAYDRLHRWNDAVHAFEEQVKVEPFHKQAWNNLGWSLQQVRKRPEAIAAYRKQIEVVPLDKEAHRNLGELLLQDPPDYKEAASELAKAEQITPDNAVVPVRLGGALLKLGDTANALAAFERSRKLSPGGEVESQIALELIDAGVEVDRGVADAKAALGRAEAESLKLDLATLKPDDAKRALALSTSWHALGWAAFKKGDLASAQRYLSAARSVRNEAAISDHLSQAVEKLGSRTDAIQYAAESLLYAESRLVRERLLRLLGNSEAAAAQALEQARARVLSERTAEYSRVSPKAGSLDFVAIFTNGSKQPAVRALTHDADLEPVLEFVRKSSFLLSFPDGTPARVVTDGRLFCMEKGQSCVTVLYFGGSLEALTVPISKR
jgi:tetratricopeptide (TPR) repeat protein